MQNRLKEVREAKGITQQQAAYKAGIPLITYQNYERGIRSPDVYNAQKIAKALKASISKLFPIGD